MDRQMTGYLPAFLRGYAEFQGIAAADQDEFSALDTAIDSTLSNLFAPSAGAAGLARFENILSLKPAGTATLTERRLAVMTALIGNLPYTMPKLKELLDGLCGTGNYRVSLASYTLTVRVALTSRNDLSAVSDLLERIVPVNLALDLSLLYRTHGNLNACGLTHGDLSEDTHQEIRESEDETT